MLLQAPVYATDVSGDITANTTWTLAASPYNATASVRVINGATLTIEAGVTVFMGTGTTLTTMGGRLLAQGTQSSPIVFTSINDQPGMSSAAQGDWGELQILTGAGTTASQLANVSVRFGQGIRINNASPVFDNLVVEDCAGPAFSLDLRSSPRGTVGALRNAVNGIVVPAGELTQQTRWALTGVPYVVTEGILHIGARPPAVSMSPHFRSLAPGQSSDFLVSLAEPSSVETVVTMSTSASGVVSVQPTVTIAAGAFSSLAAIEALSGGDAIISATLGGDSASASVTVAAQPQLALPTAATVSVGRVRSVALSRFPSSSLSTPVTVTLSADPDGIVQVPATTVIPAGVVSVDIPVSGIAPGSTSLTASATGYIPDTAEITVSPLTMSWVAPLVVPIGTINARLNFSDVAPPGGMTITLESSDPSVLSLPASLPVPAGATGLNVPVTGHVEGAVTPTASNASYGQAAIGATVEQIAVSFDVNARTLPAGFTEPFTLSLSQPAPQGGVTVSLSASDPSIATVVQPSVFIAAGQSTAAINVRGLIEGVTSIQGSGDNLVSGSFALTVGPQATLSFSHATNIVGRGLRSRTTRVQLSMNGAAFRPRRNVSVSFDNPDGASVSLPASVTILPGSAEAEAPTVGNLVTATAVPVIAIADEVQPTAVPLAVTVVEPVLSFEGLDNIRSPFSGRDSFFLQWRVPGVAEQQVAAANQVFALSVIDASPPNVVDGIYQFNSGSGISDSTQISDGGWFSNTRYIGVPNTIGTYKIQASLPGFAPWISAEQRSAGLNLAFSEPTFVSGRFMESTYIRIQRRQGGDPHAPSTALAVNLTSSDTSRVTVNSTVIIPANSSQASILITGRELTSATLINATASGYESATPLSVSVVAPEYQFAGLAGVRVPGSSRDQFNLAFTVPGSAQPTQTPRLAVADVTVINADPPDIIDGIYRSASGGTPSSFIDYQTGTMSVVGYIGSPTAPGSYAIRASVQGLAGSIDSPVQTVSANTLRFDESEVIVGQGLRSQARLRLLSQPSPVPVIVQMSCATGNCSTPTPVELYGTQLDIDVDGQSIGPDTLTADAAPSPYGAASVPVSVQPLSGRFEYYPGDDECQGGWYIMVEPGVANQTLVAEISIVDQNPPGIYDQTYELTISEGSSFSDTCFGLMLDPPARPGTFRLRATIGSYGSFDSDPVTATATLEILYPPELIAARGLLSPVSILSSISSPEPVELTVSCSPAAVCAPDLPWTIPEFSTEAEFYVLGSTIGPGTLTVGAAGYPDVAIDVDVREPTVNLFAPVTSVQVGQSISVFLGVFPLDSFEYVLAPAPITLLLSGSGPEAMLPVSVEVPQGESSVQFEIQGLQPGTFTFTAQWPGVGFFDGPTITVTP
ncbi:MAG: hypothetical protein R3F15_11855 [Lysobacterales bacterium]